ncbi:MAG: hypothetical protein R3E56_22020 [Burkholderiaceae bacterium]
MQTLHQPTLVLLPGMDGTGDLFKPFLAVMASAFDTLVIQYRPTMRWAMQTSRH